MVPRRHSKELSTQRYTICTTESEMVELEQARVRLGFKTKTKLLRAAVKLVVHIDSETWADLCPVSGVLSDVDVEVFWDSILGRVDDFQSNHDLETAVRARMARVEKLAAGFLHVEDRPSRAVILLCERLVDALDARERELLSDKG